MFFSLPDDVVAGLPADEETTPTVEGESSSSPSLPKGEESFLGTQTLYVMVRLHHLLYERLHTAREICEAVSLLPTHPPTHRVQQLIQTASFSSIPSTHAPTHPPQARSSKEASAAHPLKAMRGEESGETAEENVLAKHVEGGYKGKLTHPPTHPYVLHTAPNELIQPSTHPPTHPLNPSSLPLPPTHPPTLLLRASSPSSSRVWTVLSTPPNSKTPHPPTHPPTHPPPPKTGFKSVLLARLDGSFDPSKFEDGCRQLMGNKSYMLYTLDKVKA